MKIIKVKNLKKYTSYIVEVGSKGQFETFVNGKIAELRALKSYSISNLNSNEEAALQTIAFTGKIPSKFIEA